MPFHVISLGEGGRRPEDDWKYTTSIYQTFMTNQITELLTNYGAIAEVWIDIPGVLPRDYRNKLYRKIDDLEQKNLALLRSGSSHQPPPPQSTGMM